MKINVADNQVVDRILQRKYKKRHFRSEFDLGDILKEILLRANEFVPSDSGSILLDDPLLKWDEKKGGKLYFLACFGPGSKSLVGTYLPDDVGIVGATYKTGKPYLSEDVKKDGKFYAKIDEKTKCESRSIIALPIKIEGSIIGVLELINRKQKKNFCKKDLAMLDIFARYTSTLIVNALDARRFEDMSKRDNLTGLYNDRYFYERLSIEVESSCRTGDELSMIFFDLDHFKEVNDTYGHLTGSKVLKEVAIILDEIFLESNAMAARYGGDEFVILMPGYTADKTAVYAEKIREAIEKNTFIDEGGNGDDPPLNISGIITCSIGISSLAQNIDMKKSNKEMEEGLIRISDKAMYKAKDLGKNMVVVAQGVDQDNKRQLRRS